MRLLWAFLGLTLAPPLSAQQVTSAQFVDPTTRYGHAVLGDDIEWGGLEIEFNNISSRTLVQQGGARDSMNDFRLPLDHVFEDIEPRLWDLTGDGHPEVVVVETDVSKGAALAVYGPSGKIAETPHIGSRNRWLAPVGAGLAHRVDGTWVKRGFAAFLALTALRMLYGIM